MAPWRDVRAHPRARPLRPRTAQHRSPPRGEAIGKQCDAASARRHGRHAAEPPRTSGAVRLAAERGAETVFVQHLCHDFAESSLPAHYRPMREFVEQQTLAGELAERIERYFAGARSAADACGIVLRLPRTQPRPEDLMKGGRARCDWPWTGAYISYDGIAMPCCMVATPDRANFGAITGGRFAEVWSSDRYEEFRHALASDNPPEICRTCAVYTGTF